MTKTTDNGTGQQRQIMRGTVRPVEPGNINRRLLIGGAGGHNTRRRFVAGYGLNG